MATLAAQYGPSHSWLKKKSNTMAATATAALGCNAPTSNNTMEMPIPIAIGQRTPQRMPSRRHIRSHNHPPTVAPMAPAIHWAEATKPASVALNPRTSTR